MSGFVRLPFRLAEFTRMMWVSDGAKDAWSSRLGRIAQAWQQIEIESVLHGIRDCAIVFATPEQFVAEAHSWLSGGLHVLPLEISGAGQSYLNAALPAALGDPFVFRLALGRAKAVSRFMSAQLSQDDDAVGRLLGFPCCCTAFFRETWIDAQLTDTTWPMALRSARDQNNTVAVKCRKEANILWRWVGIRAVPHLPCSFHCEETVRFGSQMISLGRRIGFEEEMEWLEEVLSWPVEWSGLHGIAEIRTPIFKLITNTDATAEKLQVRLESSHRPLEAGTGLHFPYKRPSAKLTLSISNEPRAGAHEDAHKLNGFKSHRGMYLAHRPILNLIRHEREQFTTQGEVIDLGCGDGHLLAEVNAILPNLIPVGVELDHKRSAAACVRLKSIGGRIISSNLYDVDAWSKDVRYKLAIVCVNRFMDVNVERSKLLLFTLLGQSESIIIYTYDERPSCGSRMKQYISDIGFPDSYWHYAECAAMMTSQSER